MRAQGRLSRGIEIGKGDRLGADIVVLDGAESDGWTIVTAGSVVAGSLPAGAIVGVSPAEVLFERRCRQPGEAAASPPFGISCRLTSLAINTVLECYRC